MQSYSGVGILHAYLCEYNIIIMVYIIVELFSSEERERERDKKRKIVYYSYECVGYKNVTRKKRRKLSEGRGKRG